MADEHDALDTSMMISLKEKLPLSFHLFLSPDKELRDVNLTISNKEHEKGL